MRLWGRDWALTIGNVRITDLRVQFRCVRSLKPAPNTLDLTVYNLNDARRKALDDASTLTTYLEVGYRDGLAGIFRGDVRSVSSIVQGSDIVTRLSSGDGEKAIRGKRVAVTYGKQVTAGQILDGLVASLGLKPGNVAKAKAELSQLNTTTLYPAGVSLFGNTWRELQTFARSAGLEISIQDGAIQVLNAGEPLADRGVLLTSDTGLIGSPSTDADGTVSFQCLMIPELKPGVKVQLDSRYVKGYYRLTRVEYKGDTGVEAKDWGPECHAERIKGI